MTWLYTVQLGQLSWVELIWVVSLQTPLKSFGLVWGSATSWRRSTFIKWTGWTLAMALPWWQHQRDVQHVRPNKDPPHTHTHTSGARTCKKIVTYSNSNNSKITQNKLIKTKLTYFNFRTNVTWWPLEVSVIRQFHLNNSVLRFDWFAVDGTPMHQFYWTGPPGSSLRP